MTAAVRISGSTPSLSRCCSENWRPARKSYNMATRTGRPGRFMGLAPRRCGLAYLPASRRVRDSRRGGDTGAPIGGSPDTEGRRNPGARVLRPWVARLAATAGPTQAARLSLPSSNGVGARRTRRHQDSHSMDRVHGVKCRAGAAGTLGRPQLPPPCRRRLASESVPASTGRHAVCGLRGDT